MNYPQHVTIIMDGNGRWAKRRGLPRTAGHQAGIESVKQIIEVCIEKNISVLSLFAFSSENWQRPVEEVKTLMDIFYRVLKSQLKKLHEQNIYLRFIGDISRFSSKLQALIAKTHELTAENTGLKLLVAANYGGQWDLTQAMQRIAHDVALGNITPEQITTQHITKHLATAGLPDPDLFIRTSGEFRISNFFLWQLAYAELYFTDICWPDFRRDQFLEALNYFGQRERRFGFISEQLMDMTHD